MHSGFACLRNEHGMNIGVRVTVSQRSPGLLADIARVEHLWNEGLERFGGPWLAGAEFTAVDAFFAPVAFRVQTYALPLSASAQAYVDRLLALPAMREWYASALAEPWRDGAHEQDAHNAGAWLHDHRSSAV